MVVSFWTRIGDFGCPRQLSAPVTMSRHVRLTMELRIHFKQIDQTIIFQ